PRDAQPRAPASRRYGFERVVSLREIALGVFGVPAVGSEFEIVLEVSNGFFAGTDAFRGAGVEDATIVVGIGVVRVEFAGMVVIGEGAIPFVKQEKALPTFEIEIGIVGVEFDGGIHIGNCLVKARGEGVKLGTTSKRVNHKRIVVA